MGFPVQKSLGESLNGITPMNSKVSFILGGGIDNETIAHEALHSRGLIHSWETNSRSGLNTYPMEYKGTRNIMDYMTIPSGESRPDMIDVWKWQWDSLNEILYKYPDFLI
jgi:hypothetical protein